ncbi:MAG: hypothetical protein DRI72_04965 [Bacteroidetes bacterium]|nr:MAG: hypothetical protein DRI72_04965 [Bacteroidota bacterium]
MAKKLLFLIVLILSVSSIIQAQDTLRSYEGQMPVERDLTISQRIDLAFKPAVEALNAFLFWDPFTALGLHDPEVRDKEGNPVIDKDGNPVEAHIPLIVFWLILGAVTFTIMMKFINIRGFKHAVQLVRGVYDDPNEPGEVSHFQALTTALSATVGLGNIAGVAIAISIGGPGATFWMIVAGLLGMSSKFTECTLGVKYRKIDKNGVVSGGPMYYLRYGLEKKNLKWLGIVLSALFALLVIGGSLGGGNMFQAN